MKKNLIQNRKIKIALIGCGRIANNHLAAIKSLENDLELVGLCDSHAETLQRVADENSVPGFSSIADLIKHANPDIVTLCTPSGLHAKQCIEIANLGKHVITEKPMATRWQDGLQMVKACDDNAVFLFVVKQIRHVPTIKLLKETIQSQQFGKLYLVNLNVFWTRPQSYYDAAQWRGTWEMDGGAFMNQASHYVDLLDWLIGPVKDIHAVMGTLGRQVEVEDTGVLNIRWKSGTLGSMNVTMLTYPKNLESSLTILGEKGTVRLGGLGMNEIQHWEFENKHPNEEAIIQLNQEAKNYNASHVPYYENVIDVLRGQAKPATDGRDGLRSLEILTASYLSATENRAVSLPLETN